VFGAIESVPGHAATSTQHSAKGVQRKVGEDMKALQEKLYGQAGKGTAKRRTVS
jgi:hypothetical protein